MTDREFRKHLHEKRLEAMRAEVLAEKAEKKKPPTSERAGPAARQQKKA